MITEEDIRRCNACTAPATCSEFGRCPLDAERPRLTGSLGAGGSFIDDDEDDDDDFKQSTTACCPRQTIPDSCSCPDWCGCMCLDCICENWGEEYEA